MKKKVLVSVVLLCILAGCFIVFFSINKLKEGNLKGITMENFSDSQLYSEDEIKSVASRWLISLKRINYSRIQKYVK